VVAKKRMLREARRFQREVVACGDAVHGVEDGFRRCCDARRRQTRLLEEREELVPALLSVPRADPLRMPQVGERARVRKRMAVSRHDSHFGIEKARGLHVVHVRIRCGQREGEVETAFAHPRYQHTGRRARQMHVDARTALPKAREQRREEAHRRFRGQPERHAARQFAAQLPHFILEVLRFRRLWRLSPDNTES